MTRRALLRVGVAGVALIALAWLARRAEPLRSLWLALLERIDPLDRKILAHFAAHAPELALDPAGVARFVADFRASGLDGPAAREGEQVFLTYLLSTDYFLAERPGGPEAPLRYRALYHPYLSPCGNPCARLGPVG